MVVVSWFGSGCFWNLDGFCVCILQVPVTNSTNLVRHWIREKEMAGTTHLTKGRDAGASAA